MIDLPATYEQITDNHFPVLYWIHGGFENARQGAWTVQSLDTAIQEMIQIYRPSRMDMTNG